MKLLLAGEDLILIKIIRQDTPDTAYIRYKNGNIEEVPTGLLFDIPDGLKEE